MKRKSPSSREKLALSSLGLITLISLIPLLAYFFIPGLGAGQSILQFAPLLLGPALGGLGSALMVWFRNRPYSLAGRVSIAAALWFAGASLLGAGLAIIAAPIAANLILSLGLSLALCFTPGVILALLGAGLYWYDWRNPWPDTARSRTGSTLSSRPRRVGEPEGDVIARATQYRSLITDHLRARRQETFSERLASIPDELARWEERVRLLANRLADMESDEVLWRDRRQLPAVIGALQEQMAAETDPALQQQMEQTLSNYREHQAQLEQLANLVRRTELQLEATVTAMGTIYSQLQVLDAMDVDSLRGAHIKEDIQEQVDALGDLLAAMSEVQDARGEMVSPPPLRRGQEAGGAGHLP